MTEPRDVDGRPLGDGKPVEPAGRVSTVLRGGLVMTLDDAHRVRPRADVLVVGDRIAAVGETVDVPAGAVEIDASGGPPVAGRVLQERELGSLEPGKKADVVLLKDVRPAVGQAVARLCAAPTISATAGCHGRPAGPVRTSDRSTDWTSGTRTSPSPSIPLARPGTSDTPRPARTMAVDDGVPPLWVALWRCLFGALALLAVCAVQRAPMPRELRTWGHAAVVAALLNAAPFTLFAIGEQHVSSVLAGVINATTPLMTLIFVVAVMPGEHVTLRRIQGLLLGFAGVLCLLGAWRGLAGGTISGALACLGATACYGAGFAYTRRFFSGRKESAAALSAAQIGAATVELAVVAALTSTYPTLPGVTASIALLVLGAVGTGYAFLLNFQVIRAAGPTVAATVTYVVPIWSTLIGAVLLAEPVGWNTLLGGSLVVCGILVARSRRGLDRRPVVARLRWWARA